MFEKRLPLAPTPARSEAFRPNQRPKQIDQKAQRHASDNDVFHGSDPIESIGVGNAQAEKADDRQNKNKIHRWSPLWQG
jgi:hypothetical protein